MKFKPFVPQKLVARLMDNDSLVGSEGFREAVQYYLVTSPENCEVLTRDFGVVVRKPNTFQRAIQGVYNFDPNCIRTDFDKNRQYVISEALLFLKPSAATGIRSHDGEFFEAVEVIGPGKIGYDWVAPGTKWVTKKKNSPGESFLSIESGYGVSKPIDPQVIFRDQRGYYHQLRNLSDSEISLAHIIAIAGKEFGMKDGQQLKYGLNVQSHAWQ